MLDRLHSYGRNKLYFLRLRRFCQFILNLGRDGFYDGWLGKESYCTLNTSGKFLEVLVQYKFTHNHSFLRGVNYGLTTFFKLSVHRSVIPRSGAQ